MLFVQTHVQIHTHCQKACASKLTDARTHTHTYIIIHCHRHVRTHIHSHYTHTPHSHTRTHTHTHTHTTSCITVVLRRSCSLCMYFLAMYCRTDVMLYCARSSYLELGQALYQFKTILSYPAWLHREGIRLDLISI